MLRDKIKAVADYIIKHSRIAFPVIVIAAVAVTVTIALNAGSKDRLENGKGTAEESSSEETQTQGTEVIAMVLNEDPELTNLITTFYNGMTTGDADTLNSVCDEIATEDMLRYQEKAKYIENYPVLEIYTKSGPEAGSRIVFVYYKVVFADHPEQFPGYTAYYVCTNEQGQQYIRRGEISDEVNEYIGKILSQDDVIELNNRVTVEYNQLMVDHPELLEYLSEMDAQVNAAVGVRLANLNAGETGTEAPAEGAEPPADGEGTGTEPGAEQPPVEPPVENTVQYATATTTVNVRSSDSEQADKLGKVAGGTQLQVLEQKVNGWTKVQYEGKEGFIKSEFLQLTESSEGAVSVGTVTATTNINVRASASETADKIGVLAGGESAELIANENGWCKIKYNGQTGYVKAEYVE